MRFNNKKEIKVNKDNKISLNESKLAILKTFIVHNESELLEFLYNHLNDSKNNIKHFLSNQQILVNGNVVTQFNYLIYKEDKIQLSKYKVIKNKQDKIKLDILYEDDELIAINKPAGLLSIESDNEKSNTAYRLLCDHVSSKDKKARVFTVHRIDKETSGVLIVAKNEKLKELLQKNWQDIVKKREYIALIEGKLSKESGTVKSYLMKNANDLMYSTNDKSGKLAITHYQVIKSNKDYSLLEVNIDTGRKNQIRVHMQDLGHPIVGDDKYHSNVNPINRLGLHASKLVLIHPISKKEMTFVAKTPASFTNIFKNK